MLRESKYYYAVRVNRGNHFTTSKTPFTAMIICKPDHFVEVSVEDFEEYLESCPDYLRDSNSGGSYYEFRYNHHHFAVTFINPDMVFVDPSILATKVA